MGDILMMCFGTMTGVFVFYSAVWLIAKLFRSGGRDTVLEDEDGLSDVTFAHAAKRRLQARTVAIQLAAVAAMVDGDMNQDEVETIRDAIDRWLRVEYPDDHERRGDKMYQLGKEAINDAIHGRVDSQRLEGELRSMDRGLAYETMDLCYKVINADGPAKSIELEFAERMAFEAGLDEDEIGELHERYAPALRAAPPKPEPDARALLALGINPRWSEDRIRTHVLDEFGKYSQLLIDTPEGPRREEIRDHLQRLKEVMG